MRSRLQWVAGAVCITAAASVLAMLALGQAPSSTQSAGQVPAPAAQQQGARPAGAEAQGQRSAPATPAPRKMSVGSQGPLPEHAAFSADDVHKGGVLFLQNCAFCHGKDTAGGESGPSLVQSMYVAEDKDGENISQPIHGSRLEKGMPKFNLSDGDIHSLAAFIHSQQDAYLSQSGARKGVEPEDLLTGNAVAGKRFFEGAGGCTGCHSETSLKGVATRLTGLKLDKVRAEVKNPAEAHVDLLSKYTDDDVHNLYAYLVTMK